MFDLKSSGCQQWHTTVITRLRSEVDSSGRNCQQITQFRTAIIKPWYAIIFLDRLQLIMFSPSSIIVLPSSIIILPSSTIILLSSVRYYQNMLLARYITCREDIPRIFRSLILFPKSLAQLSQLSSHSSLHTTKWDFGFLWLISYLLCLQGNTTHWYLKYHTTVSFCAFCCFLM